MLCFCIVFVCLCSQASPFVALCCIKKVFIVSAASATLPQDIKSGQSSESLSSDDSWAVSDRMTSSISYGAHVRRLSSAWMKASNSSDVMFGAARRINWARGMSSSSGSAGGAAVCVKPQCLNEFDMLWGKTFAQAFAIVLQHVKMFHTLFVINVLVTNKCKNFLLKDWLLWEEKVLYPVLL